LKARDGERKKEAAAWTSPSNSSEDDCTTAISESRRLLSRTEKNLSSPSSPTFQPIPPDTFQAIFHPYIANLPKLEMKNE